MYYQFIRYQRAMLDPWLTWAAGAARQMDDQSNLLARLSGATYFASVCEIWEELGQARANPRFDIKEVEIGGLTTPVFETIELETPFCQLLRFSVNPVTPATPDASAGVHGRPPVLLCAPLAGHYAVQLRETVASLLADFDVYVTDWISADCVQLAKGPFHLDDCVDLIGACMQSVGAAQLHVLAISQSTIPALAAIALRATSGESTPKSLTLMGGPVDARRSPTAAGLVAASRPLERFRRALEIVPPEFPGAGRTVYPAYLQHAGMMASHPGRFLNSHWNYILQLAQDDAAGAARYRRACLDNSAVLDMAGEFYLDTVQTVFQEFRLAQGALAVRGRAVRPQDITATTLMTVEGKLDDISGPGQTHAAQDLCRGISSKRRHRLNVRDCGHYDLFSGPHWCNDIYPRVRDLIREAV